MPKSDTLMMSLSPTQAMRSRMQCWGSIQAIPSRREGGKEGEGKAGSGRGAGEKGGRKYIIKTRHVKAQVVLVQKYVLGAEGRLIAIFICTFKVSYSVKGSFTQEGNDYWSCVNLQASTSII